MPLEEEAFCKWFVVRAEPVLHEMIVNFNRKIDTEHIDNYSDFKDQPYPNVDLSIRTSGEQRTSDLFMWHGERNEF